jgi:hypothetical protein
VRIQPFRYSSIGEDVGKVCISGICSACAPFLSLFSALALLSVIAAIILP